MNKKTKKESNLNEPQLSYKKSLDIEFYKTFEEMNEAQIKEMSEIPLVVRLKFIKEIILKTYNETEESLRKRTDKKNIIIIK